MRPLRGRPVRADRSSGPAEERRELIPSFERATALRAVPLFAQLAADDLMVLAGLTQAVAVEPGAVVFAEADIGDGLYVIVRGRVHVHRQGRLLTELAAGSFFGELALLDDLPRTATVTAAERADLLRIDRDDFLDLLSLYPSVVRALLEVLARRLRGAEASAG